MKKKIKEFTDLIAWQEAHRLVLKVYEVTKKFPKEELFSLTSQIRRSVVSVSSNTAEGFGRQSYKEKLQFYYIAQGSLIETKNQIFVARDVGYISNETSTEVVLQIEQTHRLLQGLITKTKSYLNS